MNLSNLTIFALFGAITAFYQQIKTFIMRTVTVFIRTDTVDVPENEFLEHILPHASIFRWGSRNITSVSIFHKGVGKYANALVTKDTELYCLYKRTPIILRKNTTGNITVTYLYGTFSISRECKNIFDKRLEILRNDKLRENKAGFSVSTYSSRGCESVERPSSTSSNAPIDPPSSIESSPNAFHYRSMIPYLEYHGSAYSDWDINNKGKNKTFYWSEPSIKLLEDVTYWLESRHWYSSRNLVWKRSSMLTGKPGTGKSKSVLEIAKELDIPLTRYNISGMSSSDFEYHLSRKSNGEIILIEDIDSVFVGRTNILQKDQPHQQLLTFDVLINCLSGVKENDGKYIIFTTNHVEVLDEALIRAGRVDNTIEMIALCMDGKRHIAQSILGDSYANIMDDTEYTAAEFENLCVEYAIKQHWNKK